jgi:glycosyltransferase involved in cell wall biosynthesis
MHIALVTQNADLALDIRPRSEAEALAAAGFSVTLVGGTEDAARVRELTQAAVQLALYGMPSAAGGAGGQVLELGKSFTRMARTLVRLCRRAPIDVVHASNPPDNVWLVLPLLRAAQGFAPRFVFDQHDVAPVLIQEKFGSGPVMRMTATVARALERTSFRQASLVVFANSEYERRARRERLLLGPGGVVPNGWSLPEVPPSRSWRDGAEHLIAYVGAISEQDHVSHLVEAVAGMTDPSRVRVCVAGDGSALGEVQELAGIRVVADSFNWLGWLYSREEIGSLVRSADVCVAPEIGSEFNRLASFVKLVEYMSAGRPIVAHRLPQTESLCGDTVEYAEDMSVEALAAAIERLLAEPDRARELGDAARERFSRVVAWENVGSRRLVDAYRAVFRGGGTAVSRQDATR